MNRLIAVTIAAAATLYILGFCWGAWYWEHIRSAGLLLLFALFLPFIIPLALIVAIVLCGARKPDQLNKEKK